MTDGAARFAARYPRVWHVIEADGAGPWLVETGLFPAADLWEDGANRDDFRRVPLGDGRIAVLRPQLMPDRRLLPTLGGAFAGRPDQWRRHVNSHVFFWTEPRRRDAFARACMRLRADAARPHVLEFDTASLLRGHRECAFWSRINTGSTLRGGGRTRRDENTLRPVSAYCAGPVAELAIRDHVAVEGARRST